MKMEAEEAGHRRRREESEAAQRHWKERLVTRSVVFCGLGLWLLCAVVLLSGGYMTPEAKEWATTTLKYGSTALIAYLGGASHKIGS
jgi:threonine/homoserine/homoserine lactone efflux protein